MGYVHPAHRYRKAFALEPLALAVRARYIGHVFLYFVLHIVGLRFLISALKVGNNALKRGIVAAFAEFAAVFYVYAFIARAVKYGMARLFAEPIERRIHIKAVFIAECRKIHASYACGIAALPTGHVYRALPQRKLPVRHYQRRVDLHQRPKAGACWAGAVWVIKAKHARGKFLYAHPAVRASIVFAKKLLLAVVFNLGKAGAERKRRFKRACKPAFRARAHHYAVNYNVYGVLQLFVKLGHVRNVVYLAVHLNANIAVLLYLFKQLYMLALPAAHGGSDYLHPRPFAKGHHLLHNLVHGLPPYNAAAFGAMRYAYAGIKQP